MQRPYASFFSRQPKSEVFVNGKVSLLTSDFRLLACLNIEMCKQDKKASKKCLHSTNTMLSGRGYIVSASAGVPNGQHYGYQTDASSSACLGVWAASCSCASQTRLVQGSFGWEGGQNWMGNGRREGKTGRGWNWDILGFIPRPRDPNFGHVVSSVLQI